jgi:hypothetical protein
MGDNVAWKRASIYHDRFGPIFSAPAEEKISRLYIPSRFGAGRIEAGKHSLAQISYARRCNNGKALH